MGPPPRARFPLPRQRRLRKRREFLSVQGQGRRYPGSHYLFFVRRRPGVVSSHIHVASPTRFGITVTRKVGNAVTRNRIKRVVREGCRHLAADFPSGLDLVIVARASAVGDGRGAVEKELSQLILRLGVGGRR
jgi:ribonuclease P protein component